MPVIITPVIAGTMSETPKHKTIPVSESRHWQAKAAAARRKQSLRDFVDEALREHIEKAPAEKQAA
jgi:predicted HicB family RNase H-like nuclease